MDIKDLKGEIWKDIKEVNREYSVSNLGRIRCNGRWVNIGNNAKRYIKPKIRSVSYPKNGYARITLTRYFQSTLHRLIALYFISNPNNYEFVNHIDGDKHNHSIKNLEWCSRQQNEKHAYSTFLKNSTGSSNTQAKLNEMDVYEIKKLNGIKTSSELSKIYGVHQATITRIFNNSIWKHVILE